MMGMSGNPSVVVADACEEQDTFALTPEFVRCDQRLLNRTRISNSININTLEEWPGIIWHFDSELVSVNAVY